MSARISLTRRLEALKLARKRTKPLTGRVTPEDRAWLRGKLRRKVKAILGAA